MGVLSSSRRIVGGSFFIAGGAGFIGSHFVDRLLQTPDLASRVTVYDNFSSGRAWHLEAHRSDERFSIVQGDVNNLNQLCVAMQGHHTIIHLASNPDIACAATEPEIDFYQGTLLTNNIVEAVRRVGGKYLLYASGSGVYGEQGARLLNEDSGPLLPVSTYGASKLAGEALIASYCAMFGLRASAFRFANVVGPRQTHGVGFDFMRRLVSNPHDLRILGDGTQNKSYVHVSDVVNAVLLAYVHAENCYNIFNVSTGDSMTVTQIAEEAIASLGIFPAPSLQYTGGDRGWKGDVPVICLDSTRIRSLGWNPQHSTRQAIRSALDAMRDDRRVLCA